ncbi:hypothetical protein DRO61_03755 [Candidatus Bathyarchaeota archaeon]|nr:MAG: hypothetical protein DRO61_03755 [Candidatus Bathyarchaeota archaeon]
MIKFKRNAKFWGLDLSELEEDFKKELETQRRISKHVRNMIRNGEITWITSDKDLILADGTKQTKAKFKDSISYLFDEDACSESMKRNCVITVLHSYRGYWQRNKDRILDIKCPIGFKYKSFRFNEAAIKVDKENKVLLVKTMYMPTGKFRKVPYKYSLKEDLITKKEFGGNISFTQKCFVAGINVEVNEYVSNDILAFDINKDSKSWIYFNDGTVITKPETLIKLEKEIKEINHSLDKDKKVPIKKRELRSKQRRKLRLQIQKKHQKANGIVFKICKDILSTVIKNKQLLCIDGVSIATAGTFGQDKIIPNLRTMCENQGVPFYVTPTTNTSRRCALCGHIHKNNRKTADEFHCIECGHQDNAQLNAAHNIAHTGKRFLDVGVPFGSWDHRNADKLVEEYTVGDKAENSEEMAIDFE